MNSHNTAKSRNKMSVPTAYLLSKDMLGGSMLDFGCGKGKDVQTLKEMGYMIEGYDPYYQPSRPTGSFDTIIMNYVLNVISTPNSRSLVMRSAFELLDKGGILYIATRNKKDITSCSGKWDEHNDGYITKKNTFQVGLDYEDLAMYFVQSGIKGTIGHIKHNKFTLIYIRKI
jgi:DNA phosphorothioation-associated putative methyltransferase